MNGLMMDFPLTISAIFRHAEAIAGRREIVWRHADVSLRRYCYADFAQRTRRLARALLELRLKPGDRIATLAWNHGPHLETYFAVPLMGGVLHTLNLRLSPEELAYIVNHAEDRALIVDRSLVPLWEKVRPLLSDPPLEIVISEGLAGQVGQAEGVGQIAQAGREGLEERVGQVGREEAIDYETLLSGARPLEDGPDPDERSAAAMCYTTGTTGKPKGVLYSHRSLVMHTFAIALGCCMGMREEDVVLPVVPMFHANAWGMPFSAVMVGAKLVMPGPHLDPANLVDLFERERVTITGGVPTIWMGVLRLLDANPGKHDVSSVRAMFVGGSAVPQSIIEAFDTRHHLKIVQAWGMTELSPVGTMGHPPPDLMSEGETALFEHRAKQGRPVPFVEIRARNEDGLVPWDGKTMGELEVRGPWIASAYYNRSDCGDRFSDDGWFRTADIVTIDDRGTVMIQDRAKDLIKSGGEWISSVALECALMGHPAVAEAAVIPVWHERWAERPLAAVVLKEGASTTPEDLRAFLAPQFPRWWLPDAFEFIDAIPRTSAGKFQKSALRERFKDYRLET